MMEGFRKWPYLTIVTWYLNICTIKNLNLKDQSLRQKYQTKLECIKKVYATKQKNEKLARTAAKSWYSPHNPMFNRAKPGKIREVNDAAANLK